MRGQVRWETSEGAGELVSSIANNYPNFALESG